MPVYDRVGVDENLDDRVRGDHTRRETEAVQQELPAPNLYFGIATIFQTAFVGNLWITVNQR